MKKKQRQRITFSWKFVTLLVMYSLFISSLIFLHAVYPSAAIDTTTLALIILLILPWLLPYITNIKLPGGTEVTFSDVEQLERESQSSDISRSPKATDITRENLLNSDPNLALASLRLDIERKLRDIGEKRQMDFHRYGLSQMLNALLRSEVMSSEDYKTLMSIAQVANKAVHGEEEIDKQLASRVIEVGESALAYLDELSKKNG